MRTALLLLFSAVTMSATAQTTPGTAMCNYKGTKFQIGAIRTAGTHKFQCVCSQTPGNADCAPAWQRIIDQENGTKTNKVPAAAAAPQPKKAASVAKAPQTQRPATSQTMTAQPMNKQPIKR